MRGTSRSLPQSACDCKQVQMSGTSTWECLVQAGLVRTSRCMCTSVVASSVEVRHIIVIINASWYRWRFKGGFYHEQAVVVY